MMKRCIPAFLCLVLGAHVVHAQAKPTATRSGILQAGLGVTNSNSDYVQDRISGLTAYATFDLFRHLGLEADIHYVSLKTPQDFGENSYEAGPRFVYRRGRLEPYAKVLAGIATGDFQSGSFVNPHSLHYFEYGFGAGLDVRLSHRINLRAIDFEYQQWPTFPPNNLTPSLITVGVAYRIR